jgi:hypothetical protein
MTTQSWTVYTAQGDEVIATRWTDQGPQTPVSVVKVCDSHEDAQARATEMQRGYDRLRGVYVK